VAAGTRYGTRFGVTEEEEEDRELEQEMRAIEGLLRAGYLDQAFKRYKHLHETHRLKVSQYDRCIRFFGEFDSLRSGWMVYDDFCSDECYQEPQLSSHHTIMNIAAGRRDTAKLKEAYNRLHKSRFPPLLTTYKIYINALVEVGYVQDVESAIRDMEAREIKPDVFLLRSIMRMYAAKRSVKGVKACYNKMLLLGLKPDRTSYNMYINTIGRQESVEEAETAFKTMNASRNASIRPDVVTYNTIIRLQARNGRLDKAKQLYQEMIARRVAPNDVTFTILLNALCKGGDVRSATAAFDEMQKRGVEPNISHYNALLDMYLKRREHKRVFDTYLEVKRLGIRPDRRMYNLALTAYVRESMEVEALALFEDMKMMHIMPDKNAYALLMRLAPSGNAAAHTMMWFSRMEDEGVEIGEINYALVIEACLREGKIADAEHYAKHAQENRVKPRMRLAVALLRLAAEKQNIAKVETIGKAIIDNIPDWRVEQNEVETAITLLAEADFGSLALQLGKVLKAKNWMPSRGVRRILGRLEDGARVQTEEDVQPFIDLIDRFGAQKDTLRAKRAFNRLLSEGLKPSLSVYNALIRAYALSGEANLALATLEEMRSRGISPDEGSFRPIFLALVGAKKLDIAKKLLAEAKTAGIELVPGRSAPAATEHSSEHSDSGSPRADATTAAGNTPQAGGQNGADKHFTVLSDDGSDDDDDNDDDNTEVPRNTTTTPEGQNGAEASVSRGAIDHSELTAEALHDTSSLESQIGAKSHAEDPKTAAVDARSAHTVGRDEGADSIESNGSVSNISSPPQVVRGETSG